MNFKAAGVLAASFGLLAQSAFATTYIPCDNCNYAQQANIAIAQGVGRYVVGDVLGNDVNAFRVYLSSHQNSIGRGSVSPSTQQLYSDDGAITVAETTAFSHLVAFYNAAPVGYQKQFNLQIVSVGTSAKYPLSVSSAMLAGPRPAATAPGVGKVQYPTPGVNAYSVINSGPKQNQFLSWAGGLTQFAINSTVASLVQTSPLKSVGAAPWSVGITVYFQDNSHIGVYVDMTQTPAALLVNPASAIDSHGNNIPASPTAVVGTGHQNYDFSGSGNTTDQPNMRTQISGFGIAVPTDTVTYACVSTPDGARCTEPQ